MKYIHQDLGHCSRGDVVEVTLSVGANVRVLDSTNLGRYRREEKFQFYGGVAKQSPVEIPIPNSGHWHAVVDLHGLRGSMVRAGFRLLPRAA